MFSVRRIGLHEGPLYRSIRLAALLDSPDAFSETFEAANGRSADDWNSRADGASAGSDRAIFIAFSDGRPVGIAALYADPESERHGVMVQVWVAPAHRGGSVAGELAACLLSWAGDCGFERVSAWFNSENWRAARLFRKLGFELTNETQPLRPGSDLVCRQVTRLV